MRSPGGNLSCAGSLFSFTAGVLFNLSYRSSFYKVDIKCSSAAGGAMG